LLKNGLFWAALIAGFWLLVSAIHSRVITVIAMIVWWVFLYAIFYRNSQKNDSN
jgi:hypothetical protein